MRTSRVALTVSLLAAVVVSCRNPPRAPPPPRSPRVDAGSPQSRPPFPAQTLSTNARRDCFPETFRASRVKLRGSLIELCGVAADGVRCFEIDPIANRVEALRVADAPDTAGNDPSFVGPFQRTELASHGWRASTRGGALNVTGPAGNHRTVTAQGFGFHSYENTAFLPWTDGWYVVMLGWKGQDLGATAVIDPFTLRMISHAAILPCGRDS
jgi:hypothetical protein